MGQPATCYSHESFIFFLDSKSGHLSFCFKMLAEHLSLQSISFFFCLIWIGRQDFTAVRWICGQKRKVFSFMVPQKHKHKIRQMNPTVKCMYTETAVTLQYHISRVPNRINYVYHELTWSLQPCTMIHDSTWSLVIPAPYHDITRSHQPRTVPVPWITAVCRTPLRHFHSV